MKIEKLKLENFRSHEFSEMEFERFSFVVGPNACGKSSIQMALEFLLTGKCRTTDGGGRGAEDLIRLGAKDLKIAAKVQAGGDGAPVVVTRCKSAHSHTFAINGGMVPVAQADAAIRNLLGVSGDVLSAVLDADRFVEMSDGDQKALLAAALGAKAADVPKSVQADMRFLGFVNAPTAAESAAQIEKWYQNFFATRTAVRRALKEMGALAAPAVPAAPDSQHVSKQIEQLRSTRTEAVTRRAGRIRDYENLQHRRQELLEAILSEETAAKSMAENWGKENSDRCAKIEAQMAETARGMLSAPQERRLMEIEGRAGQAKSLQEKIHRLDAQIAAKQQEIDEFVERVTETCPTCRRSMDLKKRGEIQNSLMQMQDLLIADREDVRTHIEQLGDIETAKATLAHHRAAARERERLQNELRALQTQTGPDLTDIEKRIDRWKGKLEALPEMAEPNTADLDAEITALDARIEKGEAILGAAREYEAGQRAFKEWEAKRAQLAQQAEALDRLCEHFGPDGPAMSQMVGDRVAPFVAAMNRHLSAFDYRVSLTMEPYRFLVASAEARGNYASTRSLEMLSESERFRFGVAFQIALAMATELRFVCIDRADVLDRDGRRVLTQMLTESALDQAIVLSTSDAEVPDKLPEGVKFIELGREAVLT